MSVNNKEFVARNGLIVGNNQFAIANVISNTVTVLGTVNTTNLLAGSIGVVNNDVRGYNDGGINFYSTSDYGFFNFNWDAVTNRTFSSFARLRNSSDTYLSLTNKSDGLTFALTGISKSK